MTVNTATLETELTAADFEPAEKTGEIQAIHRPSLSYWKDAWIRLKKNGQAIVSLWIVIGLVAFTLLGPSLWTVDPSEQQLSRISEGPGLSRKVLVLPETIEWQEVIREDLPEDPSAIPEGAPEGFIPPVIDGTQLPAPSEIKLVGPPTQAGVGLVWSHVPGAAGYVVFRADEKPVDSAHLGIPIGDVSTGNQLSYQDSFDLKAQTYYYSVVPRNGSDSSHFQTIEVEIPPGIALSEAQQIDPQATSGQMLTLPARPLGTDYLGRDMLARLMSGARVSLFIGFFAPLLYMSIGLIIGGIAGYFGGKVDHTLMRLTDFVLALPFLLFMILFKVVFGAQPGENGILPMLVAMVALSWTGSARLTRGQILQLRESEFVQAARLLGAKPLYLIFRHLLPNTLGVILVSLTFSIPSAIFTEAFLSFIGMGVSPPTASWGSMCNDGIKTFLTHHHEFIFPALLIAITVLAFNLLGDGLRDALDPKMRSVE